MVSVRPASPADAQAMASLLGELGYPSSPEAVRARAERLLPSAAGPRSDWVYLAVGDDGVLGMIALHRFTGLHDDADLGLITALVVTEQARGLGVGRRLVDRAAETARGWGCTRLLVTTHVRRADAHAFYEHLGFEFTGRRYVLAL